MRHRLVSAVLQAAPDPGLESAVRRTSPRFTNLLAGAALIYAGSCAPGAPAPGVLMVSLDTVRADALSCYADSQGQVAPSTPQLDALATRGIRFAHVFASSPNTAPSHATLFTGLLPMAHQVANLASPDRGTPALAPDLVTLAERFADAGYETLALTDDGPLGNTWQLLAGFERRRARYQDVSRKARNAIEWLQDREDPRPPFVFFHTYQAHQPFLPPAEFEQRFAGDYAGPLRERVAELRSTHRTGELDNTGRDLMRGRESFDSADIAYLRALYLAEVAYTDQELGGLLDALPTPADPKERRWIVNVTADHGEEFAEHGHFGHAQLYRETLHVPWILSLGDSHLSGLVFEPEVGLVDVASTLLDAAGLAPTPLVPNRSLLPYLEADLSPERPLFANTNEHLLLQDQVAFRSGVRHGGLTLLETKRPGSSETESLLFDRANDPQELGALAPGDASLELKRNELRGRLAEQLAQSKRLGRELRGFEGPYIVVTDATTLDQMRALGYVDGSQ